MISFLFIRSALIVSAAEEKRTVESTFTSSEGIQFISYSSKWDEVRLKALYRVLLNCKHGEELAQLKKVILDPLKSTGQSGYRVGNYNNKDKTIRLYEVDKMPVEATLIHEYGHHFTYYWLKKKEGIYPYELTEKSEWSKLRQLDGYPVRWKNSTMPYLHKWDPGEIMAEDYVMLFGNSGKSSPQSAEELVNFARHENEYIPFIYLLPAVRDYWEKLAGLKPSGGLSVPEVLDTRIDSETDEEGNDQSNLRVLFASAADFSVEMLGRPIRYALQLLLFPSIGGAPERMTAEWSSDFIDEDIEAHIALPDNVPTSDTYYGHLSIWAYHEATRQFVHTPVYENWFQMRLLGGDFRSHVALRDIPPPWEQQGLYAILRKEGLQRWPIIYLFINGRLQAAGKQYMDSDGQLFIPIQSFPVRHRKQRPPGETIVRWGGHDLTFFARKDDELELDGNRLKLKVRLQTFGRDRAIAVSELGRLLGLKPEWNDEENSVVMEGDITLETQV
ncbi:hypothetical protein ACFQI7_05235 [Paenibacillus allorhizosphaerae]|uniref:Copper amine oxidase N-terminal domain-containing protein n=1 Tax=Paenibacillus allorhizosphaerae TaxID=2849866 RepID=A0ABN7TE28_9BACL|nr:hypothetical protein [Paenibacillus allorhizosphaerae]CAG7621992.1 hypothetical protein PAECIP111802_00778 [Paenibacillus allorhizosphaerae]